MTFQPADPADFAGKMTSASPSSRSTNHVLAAALGPLMPLASSARFLMMYLLADGFSTYLVTQQRYLAALSIMVIWRLVALALIRLVAPRRGSAPDTISWLSPLLYLFTIASVVVANLPGPLSAALATFPSLRWLRMAAASSIDEAVRYLTVQGDGVFRLFTKALLTLLSALEGLLLMTPWPVLFAVCGLLAWKRGGWALLVLVWCALFYLGMFGYWTEALQTSALVIASLSVCVVIGIPTGIWLAKSPRSRRLVSPVLDLMQTMPSFVYLLPAVAFFSIGKPPALIATVIFAVPPLIRLTCLGIEQVPVHVREAMYAHGATPLQTLLKAELPLALPSIRTGINQTIMMCLSMVVIAALIGGGGLGYNVLFALQNVQYGEGILAGLAIVFCAVLFDRLVGGARKDDQN